MPIEAQNVTVYDDSTTYQQSFATGGAADNNAGPGVAITKLIADDIHPLSAAAGLSLSSYGFSVANTDPTTSFSARVRVRFWLADGSNGGVGTVAGPGTFVDGFSFDPIAFPAASHAFVSGVFPLTGNGSFVVPANGVFWAGLTFDNGTQNGVASTATTAQLNELGGGLYDPPTIGSSAYEVFETNSPGSYFGVNNPQGLIIQSSNPPANIGWQFQAVPEPSTWTLLALSAAVLVARGRSRWRT